LSTKVDVLDLPQSDFRLKNLTFKDAFIDVLLTPDTTAVQPIKDPSEQVEESDNNPLKILLQTANLQNVNVVYNNGIGTNTTNSFNADHLNIQQLNGKFADIYLKGIEVSCDVQYENLLE